MNFYKAQKQHHHKISIKNKTKEQDTKEQTSPAGPERVAAIHACFPTSHLTLSFLTGGSESGVAAIHNKYLLYGFWCDSLKPYWRQALTGTDRAFLAIGHRCGFWL